MDRFVRGLQWPIVYALACLSPLILTAVVLWLGRSAKYPVYATMFWLGALATLAVSRSGWVSSKLLKTAIRYERKITQSVLAFVLLQPTSTALKWLKTKFGIRQKIPTEVAGNPPNAGYWLAEDNWLIRTSPYFFPAASIVLWLLSALFLPASLRSFILGVGVSYHLLSVYIQLLSTKSQSKLSMEPPLGYPTRFVWLFLIPMNLLVFATGYAFALQGFAGFKQILSDLTWPLEVLWGFISESNRA